MQKKVYKYVAANWQLETQNLFIYDIQGNLILAADQSGEILKEYFYLEGNRVAQYGYDDLQVSQAPRPRLAQRGLRPRLEVGTLTDDKSVKKQEIKVATTGTLAGLLLQANPGDIYGEVLYYYVNDHLGIPQLMADHEGQVVWRADYDPFGAAAVDPGSSTVNQHRFPGQYQDEESGLHYNYHRYYEPRSGRYITPDPIGQAGGINFYSYVKNDPVNLTDSEGLKIELCCRKLADFTAGTFLNLQHCYLKVDGTTYGLYPEERNGITIGVPRKNDPKDTGGNCRECVPKVNPLKPEKCLDPKKCVENAHNNYPVGRYKKSGPNSNTYAKTLTLSCCERVPIDVNSAPGFPDDPPLPIK